MSMKHSLCKQYLAVILLGLVSAGVLTAHSDLRPLPQKAEATIEGQVLSCWQGRALPWHSIEVRIYTMEQSKDIRALMKRWRTLLNDNTPDSMSQIVETINNLEKAVRHSSTLYPPVKTDREGRFRFRHVPANTSYLLLAVQLDTEEGSGFLDHEVSNLKPGIQNVTMVSGADSEEDCASLPQK